MDDTLAIDKAQLYLENEKIHFVKPGKIGYKTKEEIVVVFLVPETLDDKVAIIDPPDVRVKINLITGKESLIIQM